MPTFSSIGLHPDLQHCIVTESTTTTTTSSSSSLLSNTNTNTNPSTAYTAITNSAAASTAGSNYHTVSTPMALLNRNPRQQLYIRDRWTSKSSTETTGSNIRNNNSSEQSDVSNVVRPISQHQLQTLRYEVAVACIQQSMKRKQHQNDKNDSRQRKRQFRHEDSTVKDTSGSDHRRSIDGSVDKTSTTFTGMISAHDIMRDDIVRKSSRQYRPFISTSCQKLDQIIASLFVSKLPHLYITNNNNSGGIPLGFITQLSGPPASGKTQFVMSMIASAITAATAAVPTSNVQHVFYISNSQSNIVRATQRLYELLTSKSVPDRMAWLQRLTFSAAATNPYQVLHRLQEFESYLLRHTRKTSEHEQQGQPHAPIMLVIDSCSGCCTDPGNDGSHSTLLLMVGHVIRRLTRQYHLSTVLINGTVSNPNNFNSGAVVGPTKDNDHEMDDTKISHVTTLQNRRSSKPALGYRWNESVPDLCLWFQRRHSTRANEPAPYEQQKQERIITTTIQVSIDRCPFYIKGETLPSVYLSFDKKGIENNLV